jgi:hypothetical protein
MKDEHIKFDTHQESTDISTDRCNHKGKVRIDNNMLRCSCGAAWSGPEINVLFDLFNKK